MKRFNDFKNGRIDEASAPFYDSAAKIKAIVSSDTVSSKMGMQTVDSITQKETLVYYLKSNSVPGYYFKVTLTESAGNQYGEGKKYSVSMVEKIATT
jgi:predicted secreted protein